LKLNEQKKTVKLNLAEGIPIWRLTKNLAEDYFFPLGAHNIKYWTLFCGQSILPLYQKGSNVHLGQKKMVLGKKLQWNGI